MNCPICQVKMPCIGGRNTPEQNMRQRRYKCPKCGRRIYTLEEIIGVKSSPTKRKEEQDENHS